jgi:ectoine hydroxylase-related dioxygenase (phytanoyl-CoA dioxygenase family)
MRVPVDDALLKRFAEDGYVLIEEMFDAQEVALILEIAKIDDGVHANASDRLDSDGAVTRLSLKNELGDDVFSAVARSARVCQTMSALLGDEVYHYHHKLMLKEAKVGGAWEWHQDYGYWYNYGCLFPDMASCYVALDPAGKENGCLQVIRGSHKIGRIEHMKVGEQTGADPERVAAALELMEHVYVEMKPGMALFFHGNLLHRSDRNLSEHSRWSLISCYNTKHNNPYKPGRHPSYSPLEVWDDARVKEVAHSQLAALRNS